VCSLLSLTARRWQRQNRCAAALTSVAQGVAEDGIQIFVKALSGKSIAVSVAPGGTVAAVKAVVWAREGVPPAEQRLLFGGKQLDDDGRALEAYGVGKGSTLRLALRLRGGMVRTPVCSSVC
jgi:hypothetical protein